jgi:transmembrane sensor
MKAGTAVPKLNRQILEEASAWFVDFRVGDADPSARARFDEWLRASPEHIRAYMEIARTYVELPALKPDYKIDVAGLIACAKSDANVLQLREAVPAPVSPSRRRAVRGPWAVAASIALTVIALSVAWSWTHRYPTYATEIGENRSLTLSDGSTVDLNARSRLRIEFSKGERRVELLEGQALFDVTHDAARPFVVKSDGVTVRAIGTQFDVYRGSSGTTVTVVQGKVAVGDSDVSQTAAAGAAGPTYVAAGEQVTVTAQAVSKPKRTDIAAATSWTQHRLIFDGTRLSEVVDQFNRYNTLQLIIEDSELNDFRLSGVYTSTDPTSLIRFLREQPGVDVIESADTVRITRK